jgi:hypothetical protein
MTEFRPAYAHAAGAALAALALYVLTLAPTTWFWDTSEYIATAHILGIPHPPGNPLFVVVGKVWTLLLGVTGLPIAVRMNLFAAATSAAATGFLFLVSHRVLMGWVAGDRALSEGWARRLPLVGAWLGAILASTAYTVWNQSNVNEKVYTFSVLVIAAVSWMAIRWRDRKDEPGSWVLLVLAGYLMVLGSTNHLMSLLPAPALFLLVLVEKPGILVSPRFLTRAVLAVAIGLSFNFFLPLRSAQQPHINEGEPVCETLSGAAVAVFTNGAAGCPALAANLRRDQYAKPPLSQRMAPLGHQLHNWYQYFDWQWGRGLAVTELPGGSARFPVGLLFLGLGLFGLVVPFGAGRGPGVYLLTLAATLTVLLVYYLNFKYGYSLAPPQIGRELREVRERDYFFIGSFHLWGFLAGMGLVAAWRWAAGRVPEAKGFALASPLLVVAFIPLVFNWSWADRSDDYSARDWAWNLLQSVEPYGILFTNGDNDTFPLWYMQEVEGVRQDVTVIVVQYLYTDWYPRQLVHHTDPSRQRPFDMAANPGVYGAPVRAPTRPILSVPTEELNRVGSGFLPQDLTVTLGAQPIRFEAGVFLGRGERIALAMIRDAMDERPIHFAATGGLAQELGLSRWAVRQGLSSRLRIEDLSALPGVVRVSPELGAEWVDLDTSLRLSSEVHQYRGLRDREIWPDRSTLNIPFQMTYMYLLLADATRLLRRDEALYNRLVADSDAFMVTARGGTRGTP